MSTNVTLALFSVFLIAILALIIAMFVSLGKQGDERRKIIVEKSSTNTLAVAVLYLLFCVIENIVNVLTRRDLSPDGMNPFITLTVIALIYATLLVYFKKKYGD